MGVVHTVSSHTALPCTTLAHCFYSQPYPLLHLRTARHCTHCPTLTTLALCLTLSTTHHPAPTLYYTYKHCFHTQPYNILAHPTLSYTCTHLHTVAHTLLLCTTLAHCRIPSHTLPYPVLHLHTVVHCFQTQPCNILARPNLSYT
jgi:hypothetical protein